MRIYSLPLLSVLIGSTTNGWAPKHASRLAVASRRQERIRTRLPSELQVFWKKSDDRPSIQLTAEEDDALRDAARTLGSEDSYGFSWYNKPEALLEARELFPVLANYTDENLAEAYVKQKPKSLLGVFFDTPLGPVVALNVLAWATGFSWCDTPFHAEGACPPPPL